MVSDLDGRFLGNAGTPILRQFVIAHIVFEDLVLRETRSLVRGHE